MLSEFLNLSPRITVLPIIHGSGDFAVEVRRVMLSQNFDCLAVPLPASFQDGVERAMEFLPSISAVVQVEPKEWGGDVEDWQSQPSADEEDDRAASYVPIDPCQGVIAALRIAMQERMPRAFIDLETASFQPTAATLPDPYALKKVAADKFAAAVLPAIGRLPEGQPRDRVVTMANRLRELEAKHKSILFVCSMTDWPWIREAYTEQIAPTVEDDEVEDTYIYAVDPETLIFLLSELPFITSLYERARAELDDDENLSIDGIKEMLLATRDRYSAELKSQARQLTPKLLSVYFQYVRNLALVERRMTPDLYTLVVAAQQIAGDRFAIFLTETAREYGYTARIPFSAMKMGIEQARLPDGETVEMKNRLPGHPFSWRSCELNPLPPKVQQQSWETRWNPLGQCSWPPEDVAIEKFRTHVKDAALALIGTDLARSEKFSASLKDGLDIRETLRNWHTGELYVKVFPPTRGSLDCVVMLFDSPADPRDYPWRTVWHAEHKEESTLSLFATDFTENMVGPGIAMATYGGAMLLFPPRPIHDIWHDPQFDFTDTLEERLLAAACYHSNERHIALLSHAPPGAGWRRLASRHNKKLVHIPLSRFSQQTVQQLRMFHVLNGQQIRSFAAHFIRKA
ncbi:MAG: hypothetical protein HON53_04425 [Planctomycetaceae bacterium]|jgi:hypothetical protein|nr:hypothetical protein [Planctomycetaceae bacterium]MBT6158015.1 hypothetical protein [Planctomycetaceae bacterium]MBT6484774.1 hypothetical protein [Planctomycetaceae bacterium]MBT6494129.1 hypothetical protein [Planctomycetaceae bacterium]